MLKTLHPLAKLVVCLVWVAASVLIFDARFQLATIVIVVLLLLVVERFSLALILALMLPFALFGFGFLTTSVLFRQDGGFALQMAAESVLASPAFSAGITLFLRAIACGMISALFALTTDPGAFVRSLMASWRLPPQIAYALFSAMQLVPDLAAEVQQMRLARAMKLGKAPRRIPGPIELSGLLIPLLAYAIRRAGRTAIAMEARGLEPGSPRTVMGAPKLGRRDIVMTALAAALLVLCIMSIRPA
ncbi:energy-coupling factor transporter transmembrane component T family protein [Arvimicrobium flavum]|uniref:energy-coupling factor transporter transmembrane component T family protein n=1 Tax=Arvimicrobium flavum TaxID=3393320 RepID=UPI00237AFB04|nr:energy-coupling factor transporter transmembrane component T [Mesorhizobium shangrilense]